MNDRLMGIPTVDLGEARRFAVLPAVLPWLSSDLSWQMSIT